MARNRKADIGSARGAPDEVCDQIRLLARELVEDLQSQGVVSTVWRGRTCFCKLKAKLLRSKRPRNDFADWQVHMVFRLERSRSDYWGRRN